MFYGSTSKIKNSIKVDEFYGSTVRLSHFAGFTTTPLFLRCFQRRPVLLVVTALLSALIFLSNVPNIYVKGVVDILMNILSCSMFSSIYLITLETVPTTSRGLIMGCCISLSRIGAMIAPQLLQLRTVSSILPSITLGVLLLIIASAVWSIIETKDVPNFYEFSQIKDYLLPKKPRYSNTGNIESSIQSSL